MTAVAATPSRIGALSERHAGRGVLVALAAIVLLAFGLRVGSALSPLDVRPGSDSAVYASVAEQIYEHHRFAIPGATSPVGACRRGHRAVRSSRRCR